MVDFLELSYPVESCPADFPELPFRASFPGLSCLESRFPVLALRCQELEMPCPVWVPLFPRLAKPCPELDSRIPDSPWSLASPAQWFVPAWFLCPEFARPGLLRDSRFRSGRVFPRRCQCCPLRRLRFQLRQRYQRLRIALKQRAQTCPGSFSLTLDPEGCSLRRNGRML